MTGHEEEFWNWYNDIIENADISDKRYPVKGMNVWRPYGWKLTLLIDEQIRNAMESTDHDEVCFPLLIPEDQFAKEAEHIKGFNSEVYWVTHAGLNELDIKLLLRPTSETAMYPLFSLWVRSHADLPLKVFQLVNTFRYETKQTRSFIRVREIHFFEAHTCHVDYEDAERQIQEDLEIVEDIMKELCLPYLISKRPDWDKFAGAYYTLGIDTLMPTGRTLQLGSIHQYRQNFSKPYEIKYEKDDGAHEYVHQTTYGMSERLVGAIIGVHGDEKGLVLPPKVAPYQVVVVPILRKDITTEVLNECKKIQEELKEAGIRAHIDNRDLRPGNKYYHWEMRGVPLRIELGPRDMESNHVILVRRDTGEKMQVSRADMISTVNEHMDKISSNLLKRAREKLEAGVKVVDSIDDAREVAGEGIILFAWCGSYDCAEQIEIVLNASILGELAGKHSDYYRNHYRSIVGDGEHRCAVCGLGTDKLVFVARTH